MSDRQRLILCIEDEPELLDDLTQELRDSGHAVAEAHDGMEGLAAILAQDIDLVLCDVQLPRMSGLELLEQVRQSASPAANVPFIFLTAFGDNEIRELGRKSGASAVIVKPVDYDDLLGVIAKILDGTDPHA